MVKTQNDDKYSISWQASEYVHHKKSALWLIIYALATVLVVVATYVVLNHDIFSVIVIALMASVLAIFAIKQPRSNSYKVDDSGVEINHRQFNYKSFKSFSIMDYGAIESIYLDPLERFMPPISIYFEPKDGEKIANILGGYLPLKQRQPDVFDRVIHRIRL